LNLGINMNGNKWYYAVVNFIVMFSAQVIFLLYEQLALERFPTEFEIYKAVVTSLAVTLVFYGINKATMKKE